MHSRFVLGHTAVLWLALTQAGPAPGADLMELYRDAQRGDPVFEAARHVFDAARKRQSQAFAGLLPSLNLTGAARRGDGEVSFDAAPAVERRVRTRDLKLELSQPLIRPHNWATYSQADWQVVQAEAQFAQARQDLMLRLAQAYFDVLTAEDALATARTQEGAVQAQLDLANRGYRAGTAAVTDVHEARSRNDLARAQVISARNELDAKRSALEQITGSAPGRVARLRAGVRPPRPPPESGSAWVALARDNSPTVRIQTAAVEVAESEVTRARAGHWPTLDLTASKSKDYSAGSLTSPANLEVDSQSSTIGLQLSVPLFAGGAVSARVGEARSLVYKARADLDAARRSAAHAARLAHSGVINGLAQLEAMEQAVASSKSAVEGNKIGYRVGTRINVDVLNAEQQLYSAERDLARARYDTLLQGLRLKAAAGQLVEEDLQTLNDLLARE